MTIFSSENLDDTLTQFSSSPFGEIVFSGPLFETDGSGPAQVLSSLNIEDIIDLLDLT
jgi:hypothetical protein